MRTERQIQASRVNAARSRGPVTAEGKRNSSRNSVKHGLLAETVVLETERSDRFLEILAEVEDELQPETSIEHTLVQKMAVARWRQLRLWGMEKSAMDQQIRKQAEATARAEDIPTRGSMAFRSLGESHSVDLIIRYDSLCDRQYLRAHRRFLELRRGRGESPTPSIPRSRPAEVVPIREVPRPEPDTPQPYEQPQSEQSDEKQPNEPMNLLKTKQAPAANPTIPTGTRVSSRRAGAQIRPHARRYWSKRSARKRRVARLFNMSWPHINASRPKPGPAGRN